jgi:alkyl sulfatase BDS1-like metallo-beta-lactamase superfamily hydrolase
VGFAERYLELADRLWRGEEDIEGAGNHPFATAADEVVDVGEGIGFVPSFANVSAIATDDGLVLVDTGSKLFAAQVHAALRTWTARRVHTAVYSHGHIDHVFGVPLFEAEAQQRGWPAPRVVAHEAVPARFDRYILTAGYNAAVNQRQFQARGLRWPVDYRYPDLTYRDVLRLDIGGEPIELHHARGETDDHTWTWFPQRRLLCCGDLFIWASPNAGNPQKVQRYPADWASALREMAALGATLLLPGHGYPVLGAGRVRQALEDTASLLESLQDQTVAMMNAGSRLDEIVTTVRAPAALLERPYLRPIYDEPEFVVRNLWRLYGGWYDGNPAHLKPAPDAALAAEIARLAGGAARLAQRAAELAGSGELRLARHLAEMASLAAPEDAGIRATRAAVFEQSARAEPSLMARGIFGWAASAPPGPAGPVGPAGA